MSKMACDNITNFCWHKTPFSQIYGIPCKYQCLLWDPWITDLLLTKQNYLVWVEKSKHVISPEHADVTEAPAAFFVCLIFFFFLPTIGSFTKVMWSSQNCQDMWQQKMGQNYQRNDAVLADTHTDWLRGPKYWWKRPHFPFPTLSSLGWFLPCFSPSLL